MKLMLLLLATCMSSQLLGDHGITLLDSEEAKDNYEVYDYEENFAYFTDDSSYDLYYWMDPMRLSVNTWWGFRLDGLTLYATAMVAQEQFEPFSRIKENVGYERAITQETRMLLLEVWKKVLSQGPSSLDTDSGGKRLPLGIKPDRGRSFLGMNEKNLSMDGTFWSTIAFSLNDNFEGLIGTIKSFVFTDNGATELDLQERCGWLIERSDNDYREMRAEADRLHELISDYVAVDPFISPEDRKKIPKALGEEYLTGYRKLLLQYYKDYEQADLMRIEYALIPYWEEAANRTPAAISRDPFAPQQ